jgi:hypothetical protein
MLHIHIYKYVHIVHGMWLAHLLLIFRKNLDQILDGATGFFCYLCVYDKTFYVIYWGNCHLNLYSTKVSVIFFLVMNSSKLNDPSLYTLSSIITCFNKYLRSLHSDEVEL